MVAKGPWNTRIRWLSVTSNTKDSYDASIDGDDIALFHSPKGIPPGCVAFCRISRTISNIGFPVSSTVSRSPHLYLLKGTDLWVFCQRYGRYTWVVSSLWEIRIMVQKSHYQPISPLPPVPLPRERRRGNHLEYMTFFRKPSLHLGERVWERGGNMYRYRLSSLSSPMLLKLGTVRRYTKAIDPS